MIESKPNAIQLSSGVIITEGDTATSENVVTDEMIEAAAVLSGDRNSIHFDDSSAKKRGFVSRIAHGGITVFFISALIGTKLPGDGTVAIQIENLKFTGAVYPDSTVTTKVRVTKVNRRGLVWLDCKCMVRHNTVATCQAVVVAPIG